MPNTPFGDIPYPSGSDAPAAAADMMAAFMSIDDRLVLKAVDEADRDARYAEAPVSTIVASGESKKIWMKTGTGPTDWHLVHGDTGWIETGFVISTGWSTRSIGGRIKNGSVNVRGELLRTGDTIQATATGHIPDVVIATVPPQLRPAVGRDVTDSYRGFLTSGGAELESNGNIKITDAGSNAVIENGTFVRFSFSYMEG